MQIRKLTTKIDTAISKQVARFKERRVARHFEIHDYNTPSDSYDQMYDARVILSRYAARNGVKIDVHSARKLTPNETPLNSTPNNLSDKIRITVTNLRNGNAVDRFVDGDTNKTYVQDVRRTTVIPSQNKQKRILEDINNHQENTFLRNFYQQIESMVKFTKMQ